MRNTGYKDSPKDTLNGWQKDKRKWLAVTCAVLILLTGFSRNYLGVHTPQDVAVGNLLVDPAKMMNDCFKACGALLGFLIGSYVDRHYIRYEIPVGHKDLPMLVCVGVGLAFSWKEYFGPATVGAAFGGHWGNLIARLIMLLFAMCVWPLVISKSCEKSIERIGDKY